MALPLGAHRVAENIAAIGAVGKHLAGIVRQSIWTGLAVINVGGCHRDLLDKSGVGMDADMSLEAMNRGPALMLDPIAARTVSTANRRFPASMKSFDHL